jgi:6-phosphofructokinase 1
MTKTIGIITTGGDAPGMNCAIRAVTRAAIYHGMRVMGIERGYAGLIEGEIHALTLQSVGGIINRGGTILRTVRSKEIFIKSFRAHAAAHLKEHKIEVLVVIGGNGSMQAAHQLSREFDIKIIGIPASIDNDVGGTDETIGFDTAVNTAVEAIDKIRDTAASHERVFVVEVMGRDNGFIAVEVGLVCGAEAVLVPEIKNNLTKLCKTIKQGFARGKTSSIIVMAEGAGDAKKVAEQIKRGTHTDVRLSVLGHIQRGGSPTARSRMLASKFGAEAVTLIRKGELGRMVAIRDNKITSLELKAALNSKRKIDLPCLKLAQMLAT